MQHPKLDLYHVHSCILKVNSNTPVREAGFYAQLQEAVDGAPKADKVVALGDFNARVGNEEEWSGVIGKQGKEL